MLFAPLVPAGLIPVATPTRSSQILRLSNWKVKMCEALTRDSLGATCCLGYLSYQRYLAYALAPKLPHYAKCCGEEEVEAGTRTL